MPLKGVADAVNVTDSPGAKAHMSSLTASAIIDINVSLGDISGVFKFYTDISNTNNISCTTF